MKFEIEFGIKLSFHSVITWPFISMTLIPWMEMLIMTLSSSWAEIGILLSIWSEKKGK